VVRTAGSHPVNIGSIPIRITFVDEEAATSLIRAKQGLISEFEKPE